MPVQVEYPWQIWAYNAGVNPVVSPDSSEVQVPASCCVSNTNCSSSNPASIWADDCYHKVRQASRLHPTKSAYHHSGCGIPTGPQCNHGQCHAGSRHHHGTYKWICFTENMCRNIQMSSNIHT